MGTRRKVNDDDSKTIPEAFKVLAVVVVIGTLVWPYVPHTSGLGHSPGRSAEAGGVTPAGLTLSELGSVVKAHMDTADAAWAREIDDWKKISRGEYAPRRVGEPAPRHIEARSSGSDWQRLREIRGGIDERLAQLRETEPSGVLDGFGYVEQQIEHISDTPASSRAPVILAPPAAPQPLPPPPLASQLRAGPQLRMMVAEMPAPDHLPDWLKALSLVVTISVAMKWASRTRQHALMFLAAAPVATIVLCYHWL